MKSFRESIRRALAAPCNLNLQPFLQPNSRIRHEVTAAKKHLSKHGYSYRTACEALGLGRGAFVRISNVLNGKISSPSLLKRIMDLPVAEEFNLRAGVFTNGGAQ